MQRYLACFRIALKIALAISGAVLLARAAFGPFQLGVSVRNPIGSESVFGVCAVLLLLLSVGGRDDARPAQAEAAADSSLHLWIAIGVGVCVGLAAWAWSFRFPFIADDYVHVTNGLHATGVYVAGLFTVPAADRFFRPFGYLALAAEARVFGMDRIAWHAFSFGVHVLTGVFVFSLARALRVGLYPAVAAAIFFLLHGTRPEAVAWVSAQFDLLAAFFALASFAAFLRYTQTGRARWQAISLALLLCGLLSKESAYVFPLIVILWLGLSGTKWRETIRDAAPSLVLTGLVFLYRWFLLGGIGGYRDAGSNTAFFYSISPLRSAKALFARAPAISIFPLNWSVGFEWWMVAGLVIGLGMMIAVAIWEPLRRSIARANVWFGMGFFLIAALPVHLFLLIDSDLEKSRVLYLPMVGAALVLGALLDAMKPAWAAGFAAALLVFQTAALEHNLKIWRSVAELAETTCASAAREMGAGPVRMTGIPNVVDGVYFLHTGFRKCVEQAAGRGELQGLITDTDPTTSPVSPVVVPVRSYRWDGRTRGLVEDAGVQR